MFLLLFLCIHLKLQCFYKIHKRNKQKHSSPWQLGWEKSKISSDMRRFPSILPYESHFSQKHIYPIKMAVQYVFIHRNISFLFLFLSTIICSNVEVSYYMKKQKKTVKIICECEQIELNAGIRKIDLSQLAICICICIIVSMIPY